MIMNGEDVTGCLRSPETSMAASTVSAMPPVRAFLLSMQRDMAKKYDVVMDGRDIGTVILPQAGLKVFLTAKPETRAHRRHLELLEKGVDVTFDEVLRDINLRDKNDSEREAAPLRPAEGAITLDTTEMSLDESFRALCNLIEARYGT
jgi:cytidylate kinase